MIFLGIVIEALPFVLLGVFISTMIAHYVDENKLIKIIPKNRFGAIIVASFIGFLFPVCECGNIPVARRLINKGVKPNVVLTFLLAAPVINPVVIFATWSAFKFMPEIVYLRIIFTFLIAWLIGFIFSFYPDQAELVSTYKKNPKSKHLHGSFSKTLSDEFFEMMKVLVFGALLASFIQVIIPRNMILAIGTGPILSVLAMILFAFVISVCSNVDAFIALSYVNSFLPGSLLAFLVFGPMIDLKSLFMYNTIFNWKTIFKYSLMILLLTTFLTFFMNLQIS